MADDNVFTFDTSPFMRGLEKVHQGITGVQKGAVNMAKSVSRGMISAAKQIGLLVLSFKGLKAGLNQIPEIGKTFEIAKDVILKNLLFPLRKDIFPLLQKLLDWVRDNRALFVKWGQGVANVFRVVFKGIQSIIATGEKLAGVFKGFIARTFGLEINSFEELINVLSFKLAVLIEFLKTFSAPAINLFTKIGDIVSTVLVGGFQTLVGFVSGFLTGINEIPGGIQDILTLFNQLLDSFFSINEEGNNLQTIFTTIGKLIGNIVGFVTKMTASFLTGFIPSIKGVITPIQTIADSFKRIFDSIFGSNESLSGWSKLFEIIGESIANSIVFWLDLASKAIDLISKGIEKISGPLGSIISGAAETGEKILDFFKNPFDDVIITKKGQVVPVSPDDNIVAFKDNTNLFDIPEPTAALTPGEGMTQKVFKINADFSGMQWILQNGTPQEIESATETMVEMFRRQLTSELDKVGA